jgi:hypothetical protein
MSYPLVSALWSPDCQLFAKPPHVLRCSQDPVFINLDACAGEWLVDKHHWRFSQARLDPCMAQFVPEPGTIALLRSGLAGLAGYATVR